MRRDEFDLMERLEDGHWWFVSRREAVASLLAPVSSPLLDVGCGTGGNLAVLDPGGTGIDLSIDALRAARRRGLRRLVRADARRLPFRDGTFATLASLDVFEHIEADEHAMMEAARVLRPGGTIAVSVPIHPELYGGHDRSLGHCRRYSVSVLVRRLGRAGFRVDALRPFLALLFPLVAIGRLMRRWFLREAAGGTDTPMGASGWTGRVLRWMLILESRCRAGLPASSGLSVLARARKPDLLSRSGEAKTASEGSN